MKSLFNIAKPHLIAMGIFLVVFAAYFAPQLDGKVVRQGDIIQGMGMAQEANDYHTRTGKFTLWTNAMFGGMPTYQISSPQNSNIIRRFVEPAMQLFMAAPISWFFVAALCFYILMMVMGVNHWLSIMGGLVFALSTNNMLLYGAGHTSKFRAISYIPLIIAGVYLLLQKRNWLAGAVCFLIGMALNISANHYQMTYYFAIGMGLFMLIYLGFALKNNDIVPFVKAAGIMIVCAILAVGPSFSKIYTTAEYAPDTMRGTSELKEEASARKPGSVKQSGLKWDYAMTWSNAPRDMFSTFIPRAVGGGSQEIMKEGDAMEKYFGKPSKSRPVRIPLYWGGGDSTDGPTYFGAIIFFLFLLGVVILPDNGFKYGIIGAFVIIACLSMGKYFESFNRIVFNHFPKYDSFRAHNSAMSVVAALFPILAVAGCSYFFTSKKTDKQKLDAIKIAGGIALGITAIYGLMASSVFEMTHNYDGQYESQFKDNAAAYQEFLGDLNTDRISALHGSAIRTFFLILLAVAGLWFYVKKQLKLNYAILLVGVLAVADILLIDKNYLNEEDFVTKKNVERSYTPREVDMQIMQAEPMGRGYYRVLDLSINTFSSSSTSYFHNTVGGYSAVKLQRVQDLIDSSFANEINFSVLNMFNTKYIIDGQGQPQINKDALGNAWFVDTIFRVESATDELKKVTNFNSNTTAVVHKDFDSYMKDFTPSVRDSNTKAEIKLTSYEPNKLVYKCNSDIERFVVFSEVWYGPNKGWISTLNNKEVEHIRVNHLLRGMRVPAGESEIIFEFKPQTYAVGEKVSLASSILILLVFGGWLFMTLKPIVTQPVSISPKNKA